MSQDGGCSLVDAWIYAAELQTAPLGGLALGLPHVHVWLEDRDPARSSTEVSQRLATIFA